MCKYLIVERPRGQKDSHEKAAASLEVYHPVERLQFHNLLYFEEWAGKHILVSD